jgi:nucleoside phosphorylase
VVQFDFGIDKTTGFEVKGTLNSPPQILLKAVQILESNQSLQREGLNSYLSVLDGWQDFKRIPADQDILYKAEYNHAEGELCERCDSTQVVERKPRKDIMVHFGTIASSNRVMKDGLKRDRLSDQFGGILCFEMEAAGLTNSFPSLVIRGICDYSDSHKNWKWQPYAAGTAAACAKAILSLIPGTEIVIDETVDQTIEANDKAPTEKAPIGKVEIVSPDFFLHLDSVRLGRFVKFVNYPAQGHHDPPYPQDPQQKSLIRYQNLVISQKTNSESFATKLAALMSRGFTKRAKTPARIEIDAIKSYYLDNSDAWFKQATDLDETRRWIERSIGGNGIYFIVGFHTVTNARIVQDLTKGLNPDDHPSPLSSISPAMITAIAGLGNIVQAAENGNHFVATGEQICALQYRRVFYQWLRSKITDNLVLSKAPRWLAKDSWRQVNNEDEPDVLEVELGGFEIPDEEDWDQENDEDGKILILCPAEEMNDF